MAGRALRQEVHHRLRRHLLAGAAFADDGERLAARERKRLAAHGVQDAVAEREIDAEVVDLEQGHGGQPLFSGAVTSRSPSPTRLIARTSRTSAAAGMAITHGLKNMYC